MAGFDFTGTDAWVTTLTGPANTEDLTAESCTDMGVQCANRTAYLAARMDDAYTWRHVKRTDTADASSAYGIVATVTSLTWAAMAAYFEASHSFGALAGIMRITWLGTIQNNASDFGEVRLTAGTAIATPDDISPHVKIGSGSTKSINLELITAVGTPLSGAVLDVGLVARAEEIDGAMLALGSGRLDIWKMTKVEVP